MLGDSLETERPPPVSALRSKFEKLAQDAGAAPASPTTATIKKHDSNELLVRWSRLRSIPIQRRYPGILGPGFATYESLLLAIRHRPAKVPRDIDQFIRQQIVSSTRSTLEADLNKMIEELARLENAPPESRLVYRCPRRHVM